MTRRIVRSRGALSTAVVIALFLATPSALLAAPSPGAPAGGTIAHDGAPRAHDAHGAGHGEHHGIGEFNWFHGFIGEKAGEPPSLLWRPPGMPVPFAATLLNYGILFGLLFHFARKPIGDGLRKRKLTIMKGIEDAAAMKRDAAASLDELEKKLAHVDDEIERVKRQMLQLAERERERVVGEAKERRERMVRDAKILIDQELAEARSKLQRDTVRGAIASARDALTKEVNAGDQTRVANEYLDGLRAALTAQRRASLS